MCDTEQRTDERHTTTLTADHPLARVIFNVAADDADDGIALAAPLFVR